MTKFDFEGWKKKLTSFAGDATAASLSTGQLLWSPRKFHVARLRRRKTRLAESMQFAVFSSAAMIVMYYVTVSSVIKVRHPLAFLMLGGALNLLNLLVMASIVAGVGRALLPKVQARVHIENVLYATVLLPILAFFAQPLMDAQLRAYLRDTDQFSSSLHTTLGVVMASSGTATLCNFVVFFTYMYFARIIYVGLRVTASVSAWRAAAVMLPSLLVIYLYQYYFMMASTQQFVHSMTLSTQ